MSRFGVGLGVCRSAYRGRGNSSNTLYIDVLRVEEIFTDHVVVHLEESVVEYYGEKEEGSGIESGVAR